MIIRIVGENYLGMWTNVEEGKEEEISKKLVHLQEEGIENLCVEQQITRDVTDYFAVKYVEREGKKFFFGNGGHSHFASKYHIKGEPKVRKFPEINHPNIVVAKAKDMSFTFIATDKE